MRPVTGARDETKRTLRDIIERYGPEVADDPRRAQALLRDMVGENRAEVAALVAASEEGVGATLLQSSRGLTPEAAKRLARRLQENRALTEDAAVWAVTAWLHALGVEGPTEVEMTTPIPNDPSQPGPAGGPATSASTPPPPPVGGTVPAGGAAAESGATIPAVGTPPPSGGAAAGGGASPPVPPATPPSGPPPTPPPFRPPGGDDDRKRKRMLAFIGTGAVADSRRRRCRRLDRWRSGCGAWPFRGLPRAGRRGGPRPVHRQRGDRNGRARSYAPHLPDHDHPARRHHDHASARRHPIGFGCAGRPVRGNSGAIAMRRRPDD